MANRTRQAGADVAFDVNIPLKGLASAIESELREYFFDGVSPTLGQYAIDHITGGICQRVRRYQAADEDSQ